MTLKAKRTDEQKATALARSIRKFGDAEGDRTQKLTALQEAAAVLGRKGGQSKSPKKAAASRRNGLLNRGKKNEI